MSGLITALAWLLIVLTFLGSYRLARYLAVPQESAAATNDPVAYVLEPIRTLGLVVYTLFFSAASLGVYLPRRLLAGLRGEETE